MVEVLFSAKLNASALCGALCGSSEGLLRVDELMDADDEKEEGAAVEFIFELVVISERLFCCCCC